MTVANWKTQSYNVVQSLLFNNPRRVIEYKIRDGAGNWIDRASKPAPVRRLYETEAAPDRTCLKTIQFVHHVLIPPGARHVEELHIHPDAEEIVVVTRGEGVAMIGNLRHVVRAEDVIYIPPGTEHEVRNSGDDFLGLLFVCVPTGEGIRKLLALQSEVLPGGGGVECLARKP
jgi:quercetin dioxygenase-like cupin family protein